MKLPRMNVSPTVAVVLAVIAVVVFGAWTIDDWTKRQNYVDLCVTRNYTAENGFPPGLRSFCIASWRLR